MVAEEGMLFELSIVKDFSTKQDPGSSGRSREAAESGDDRVVHPGTRRHIIRSTNKHSESETFSLAN